jgi:hypothetical protein
VNSSTARSPNLFHRRPTTRRTNCWTATGRPTVRSRPSLVDRPPARNTARSRRLPTVRTERSTDFSLSSAALNALSSPMHEAVAGVAEASGNRTRKRLILQTTRSHLIQRSPAVSGRAFVPSDTATSREPVQNPYSTGAMSVCLYRPVTRLSGSSRSGVVI